jgi:hypothetical protein
VNFRWRCLSRLPSSQAFRGKKKKGSTRKLALTGAEATSTDLPPDSGEIRETERERERERERVFVMKRCIFPSGKSGYDVEERHHRHHWHQGGGERSVLWE